MLSQNWKKEHLFLDHVTRIAKKINEKCPDIGVIIWDDMMRDIDIDILKGKFFIISFILHNIFDSKKNKILILFLASNIGSLVTPMAWHYLPIDEFKLKSGMEFSFCFYNWLFCFNQFLPFIYLLNSDNLSEVYTYAKAVYLPHFNDDKNL